MSAMEVRKPNPIDDKILRLAGSRSPEEISRALGGTVSPEKVASHLQTLLRQKDWLTATQQDALITYRMQSVLSELEDRFLDIDHAKVILQYLKALGDRLDKRAAATDHDLTTLYSNQGQIMARAYDIALSYMKGALRDDVDPEKWDTLAQDALTHAQAELAKYELTEQ